MAGLGRASEGRDYSWDYSVERKGWGESRERGKGGAGKLRHVGVQCRMTGRALARVRDDVGDDQDQALPAGAEASGRQGIAPEPLNPSDDDLAVGPTQHSNATPPAHSADDPAALGGSMALTIMVLEGRNLPKVRGP
jgi:hypothetical protein